MANDQKQTKIRLDIDWLPVPKRSRQAPIFTDDDNDIQQGCYFEHVEPGYVKDETFVDRSVRLLQAEDVDSERLWFRIAGDFFERISTYLSCSIWIAFNFAFTYCYPITFFFKFFF